MNDDDGDGQLSRCFGKVRFPDKRAAATARNARMNSRYRRGKPKYLRIYPCPSCGGWHLTHTRNE